jgi:oligopeptide/dipeptide ABC transporter ATP-binding protein
MLQVQGLRISAKTRNGVLPLVRGIDFDLEPGGTLGLVGESGSGKTVTCLALLGLLPRRSIDIAAGRMRFAGRDLLGLSSREWRKLRGRDIAMVFQDPMTSLNPLLHCGEQVAEAIRAHQGLGRAAARQRALELLEQMGLEEPERRYRQYPFELSGGMRQRVLIAVALSCKPRLLIADEPTTALDVTLQAQILELIRERQRRDGMALILITHDLAVARGSVDELLVLYAGEAVERGPAARVLEGPRHPYTLGLLQSLPPWDARMHRLLAIEGVVPHPEEVIPGCRFHPRCAFAGDRCRRETPRLGGMGDHAGSCHFSEQIAAHRRGAV